MNTLLCLTTMVLNISGLPMNVHDFDVMERATRKCEKQKQCLTRFEKRDFRNYRGICGKKTKFSRKKFEQMEINAILQELSHLTLPALKNALKEIGYTINKDGSITKGGR